MLLQFAFDPEQARSKASGMWIPFAVNAFAAAAVAVVYSHGGELPLKELVQIYVTRRHPHHFDMPFILKREWPQHLMAFAALLGPTLDRVEEFPDHSPCRPSLQLSLSLLSALSAFIRQPLADSGDCGIRTNEILSFYILDDHGTVGRTGCQHFSKLASGVRLRLDTALDRQLSGPCGLCRHFRMVLDRSQQNSIRGSSSSGDLVASEQ